MCADALALRNEAEGTMTRLLAEWSRAAVLVVKRQGSYLAMAVAQMKLNQSLCCCGIQASNRISPAKTGYPLQVCGGFQTSAGTHFLAHVLFLCAKKMVSTN